MGFEPTVCFRSRIKSPRPSPLGSPVRIWLSQVVSNHRPLAYQASALPLSYGTKECLVNRGNFEIPTLGLRDPCSASELPVHETLFSSSSHHLGLNTLVILIFFTLPQLPDQPLVGFQPLREILIPRVFIHSPIQIDEFSHASRVFIRYPPWIRCWRSLEDSNPRPPDS